MPPSKLLESLSPAKRALFERRLRGEVGPVAPVIPRRAGRDPAPLSHAQERLWFVDQLLPGTPVHNIPAAFVLDGPLDVEALERSLGAIVARHETLRTVFASADGRPLQVVRDEVPVRIERLEADSLHGALGLASEAAYRPFDLARGPLFRAGLYRLAAERHLLTLTLHHIIADEWSIAILLREWTTLFHAYRSGVEPQLPELAIQYSDYALWERDKSSGDAAEAALEHWRMELDGLPDSVHLPTDFRRTSQQTFRGSGLPFELPEELAARIDQLARDSGATLFMTLLAIFQAFLFRLTGQDRLAVNWAVADRPAREAESLIGCFINILVVRSDVEAGLPFRQLLDRVRVRAVRAFSHRDAPFEEVVRRLRMARDLTRHPFSQVMLVLLNAPTASVDVPGLQIRPVLLENAATPYDLMAHFWENERSIGGILRYSTELFRPETARLLLGRLRSVIEAIASNPDTPLERLPNLGTMERRQIVADWNATAAPYPHQLCLHQLAERRCDRDPGALAVAERDRECTYAELEARANRFARRLRSSGVDAESIVGVYLRPSLEMVVALLGVLKAGAAYAPLDPAHPPQRLRVMLAEARAAALVAEGSLGDVIEAPEVPVIRIDEAVEEAAQLAAARPESRATPQNLAYVVFTSGSTGTPKAIGITHGGVVNNMLDVNDRYSIGPADRVLAVSSLGFDMSVHEIFGTLAAGACIVIPARESFREPREWSDLMSRRGVTVWSSAPALLDMLISSSTSDSAAWGGDLRLALLAGDWIPVTLPARLRRLAPEATMVSLGGAAEASVYTVSYRIPEVEPQWLSIPYGRPMANQRVYVVDASLDLAPVGVAGELCLAGVGLGRGYLHRPGETAAKYVANPHYENPGERLYRTGDLARWMPDGNLELLGRIDLQVKIHGVRMELVEIEATLKRHPTVTDAVVVAQKSDRGDTVLVGYLIPAAGAAVSVPELKAFLRQRLPKQMCPAELVTLDSYPLLPSGKVNRRALPRPSLRPAGADGFEAPRNALEEVIAGIWRQVLSVDAIGIHDDFFDLDGHSLLAVRVMTRVQAMFGVELPLRMLFEARTVASFSARLETEDAAVRARMHRIAELALEVERMSEAEVQRRIAGWPDGGRGDHA